MLKKRLVGVVTVKNGWAVQSFGYRRYLPLGKPECLVENLDRWEADEILVQVIDRSANKAGPDFKLLERIGSLGLGTSLIYAGGIRSVSDGVELIQLGADRLVVDAVLRDDMKTVQGLSDRLGAQALIASLPLSRQGQDLVWLDHRTRASSKVPDEVLDAIKSGVLSEVLVTDWQNEGRAGGFDMSLVERFPLQDVPLIAFGGISETEQMSALLQSPVVTAIAVGNFLTYREHAVQKYKEALTGMPIRSAIYETTFSLITEEGMCHDI